MGLYSYARLLSSFLCVSFFLSLSVFHLHLPKQSPLRHHLFLERRAFVCLARMFAHSRFSACIFLFHHLQSDQSQRPLRGSTSRGVEFRLPSRRHHRSITDAFVPTTCSSSATLECTPSSTFSTPPPPLVAVRHDFFGETIHHQGFAEGHHETSRKDTHQGKESASG